MNENEIQEPDKFQTPDPKLVEQAFAALKDRSYSGRNAHLGKMVNCKICGRRHRETQELRTHTATDGVKRASKLIGYVACVEQPAVIYVTEVLNEEIGQFEIERESPHQKDTEKSHYGAALFKGKRRMPRGNGVRFEDNQLLDLTRELFPKYQEHYTLNKETNELVKTFQTDKDAMLAARGEAAAILKRKRKAVSKCKRQQQQLSRAINRGLATPGSQI